MSATHEPARDINLDGDAAEPPRSKMDKSKITEFEDVLSTRLDLLAASKPTPTDKLQPVIKIMRNYLNLHQMHLQLYNQYKQSASTIMSQAMAEKAEAQQAFEDTREMLLPSGIDLNKPDDALAWIKQRLEMCGGDDWSIGTDLAQRSTFSRLQLLRAKLLVIQLKTFKINDGWKDETDTDGGDFGGYQLPYGDGQEVRQERGQSNEKLRCKADHPRRQLFQPKSLVVDLGEFKTIGDGQPKDKKATENTHQSLQKSKAATKEHEGYFENWEGLVISLVAPVVMFSCATWLVSRLPSS